MPNTVTENIHQDHVFSSQMLSDKILMKCIHDYTELGIKCQQQNFKLSGHRLRNTQLSQYGDFFSVTDVRSCKKMTLTCLSA